MNHVATMLKTNQQQDKEGKRGVGGMDFPSNTDRGLYVVILARSRSSDKEAGSPGAAVVVCLFVGDFPLLY